MNMFNLFPIPIGIFQLDRELTKKELTFIIDQDTSRNMGNTHSTNSVILKNKALTTLRSWLEDCVNEYFNATVNPLHPAHLRITQSWVNYSEPGQFHHKHAHPNSYISGVFYAQTTPQDRIYFFKSGFEQIRFAPKDWNLYNSSSWWFEANVGRLILFPSHLEHHVPTVEGSQTRISLSFNTFPVGYVGNEAELTELKLEG